jgi:hypothetical protein
VCRGILAALCSFLRARISDGGVDEEADKGKAIVRQSGAHCYSLREMLTR